MKLFVSVLVAAGMLGVIYFLYRMMTDPGFFL
jgi:hypothetical protein